MHRFCGLDVLPCDMVLVEPGERDYQVRTKPTMYNKLLRSVLAVAFAAAAFAVATQTDVSSSGGDVSWDNASAAKLGTADVSWDIMPARKAAEA